MNAPARDLQEIVTGRCADPFALLGPHATPGGVTVRVFAPQAQAVTLIEASGAETALRVEQRGGLYAATLPARTLPLCYRLRVTDDTGSRECEDPYRFGPVLGELDSYLLARGDHRRVWEVLGAHPRNMDGVAGVSFAVWAPNARRVSVVGPFNGWDGRVHVMRARAECGVWEIFVPGLGAGTLYKYELLGPDWAPLPLKADPFAFASEHPPATSSIVAQVTAPKAVADWDTHRAARQARQAPISIYEVHLGSWRRAGPTGDSHLSYRDLAGQLVDYVRDLGFTHIELLPITEHPFEGSWGYQPTGLYAPTSRHGTPDDFAHFVQRCHEVGIGVLMDWVPGHFPNDAHGLAQFDGTHLYEHHDPRQGFHPDWNTLIYNFGRAEVANFLLGSALYWLGQYRIDGLRVDAVASMLYLDYSRKAGEWVPNRHGGNENLEAVDFLRRLNETCYGTHPGAITVAEESTAWPAVSRPTYLGGLGFGYKWNMGWMHDTLDYMAKDPIHRRFHHDRLTFGLLYAFSENFILPLSHDEVVHGKGSLLTRMPGDRWQQFANLRAYYGFMWTHPGKKLLFMGGEFAHEREWSHQRSLDWHLLDQPEHAGMQRLVRDLNTVYRALPALHEKDCDPAGFAWLDANDPDQSVLSYLRRGSEPQALAVTVCNFTPVVRERYRVGVPRPGWWREHINTDASCYAGSGVGNQGGVASEPVPWHGHAQSVCLTLPPLATVILAPEA
ncbi:1,4-alpha-glucan branching protein GlgB [Immundisolibacter sp.]|uniref:1,4-alpha-glucan branching protein GlgB n=1 Tax=Immundisolibacter sp. TaxID=1934948 RepID=UPI0019A067C1|nr:1,4-alpha-glucan branching protein GlgB [Immundisolibacter sp.]MBC7162621.1 1,4-alpha-glucan branching protein GlgB [Immundisolibacter sp.]MEA3220863.1 1,4-alpha-glucan branching enzyme GlgB [Immundisolibacter sp.]